MEFDPDAQEITINYTGGSLTMVLGNAKDLFGEDSDVLKTEGETTSFGVDGHQRVRVIGEPSVQVKGHNRTFTKWPTSVATNAAAGRKAKAQWQGSEGWWTIRYSGPAASLGDFLDESALKPVRFTTSRGSKYGPYKGEITDGN